MGAVDFCQINVFVDGDADGNVRECEHFGDGDLHDDHVHVGQSRKVPVFRRLAHVALVGVGIENGGAEEFPCEVFVFLVFVFGQQFLSRRVFGLESPDGFQHEGIDHFLVVVPVEAFLFEQCVEVFVFLNDLLVDFPPHLAVGLVGVVVAFDVVAIDFALFDEVADFPDELNIVFPREFQRFGGLAQHSVVVELQGEFVFHEFCCRHLCALALCPLCANLHAMLLFLGDGHDEQQQQIVQVIRFRQAEKQFFLSVVKIAVAVLVIGIGELHNLDSNQFSVDHLSLKTM